MQIPFSGPFNMLHAGGGIVLGIILNIAAILFTLRHYDYSLIGPAVKADDIAEACRLPMLATVGWCLVYWNMIGANVCCIFGMNAFEVIPKDKVTLPDFTNAAGRFAGNSAEHAPVFMAAVWMGTMFVDASSAGVLGCCYVVQRMIYPWMYMVLGSFNMKFEYCTQMGYGFLGQMLLGCLMQGFGANWVNCVTANPIGYTICGFLFGSLALFPALPLGGPYAAIHYGLHRALHFKESTSEERERLRS